MTFKKDTGIPMLDLASVNREGGKGEADSVGHLERTWHSTIVRGSCASTFALCEHRFMDIIIIINFSTQCCNRLNIALVFSVQIKRTPGGPPSPPFPENV